MCSSSVSDYSVKRSDGSFGRRTEERSNAMTSRPKIFVCLVSILFEKSVRLLGRNFEKRSSDSLLLASSPKNLRLVGVDVQVELD